MRAATQNLLSKGPASATAAIQSALASVGLRERGAAAEGAAAQPAMRDINPPPAARQGGAADARVHDAAHAQPGVAREHRQPEEALQGTRRDAGPVDGASHAAPGQSAAERAAESSAAAAAATSAASRAAQDMLARMGISGDMQATMQARMAEFQANMPAGLKNLDLPQFDFSSLDLPAYDAPSKAPPLPEGAQFLSASYRNGAGMRNYKLYIPSSYHGQAMPLLVMLHGCTQNPDDFASGTQMNQVAEERHCFVAYPEQPQGANSSRCWNWFNAVDQTRGQGEPSLIAGIAQQIMDEYPVNPRQVYVAGLSAGGAMAVIVGTLYPDLFAAVGVHSGLPYASAKDLPSALSAMKRGSSSVGKNGGSLPIIVFHGDKDSTVNPVNGEQVLSQRLQGQPGKPSVQTGSVPNGHRYTQTTHQQADGKPLAEHWLIHGASHAWSGGSNSGSYTDAKGPDASREMMRFFRTVS
ncbi:PHB depolymerase family esterase [Oxalobacteraceae bacterium]|nr:PHB depolymerase family esterase [Oxalobacteraceae bacterium]